MITRTLGALLRACHPGPTVAVTVLAVLLAVSFGLKLPTIGVLALAVFSGQLSIGWSNDLLDRDRDCSSGRTDKPLATGALVPATVHRAIAVALLVCVFSSLLCGLLAGLVHLILVVGSGWTYNVILKRTFLSFLPYAIAFGSLPAVVSLAANPPQSPPAWIIITGALLGVGAHLVNALPDFVQDAATGVSGLPHRLGARTVQIIAPSILVGASVTAVLGPAGPTPLWAWLCLLAVILLAGLVWVGSGRTPFRVVIIITVVDAILLVIRALTA